MGVVHTLCDFARMMSKLKEEIRKYILPSLCEKLLKQIFEKLVDQVRCVED